MLRPFQSGIIGIIYLRDPIFYFFRCLRACAHGVTCMQCRLQLVFFLPQEIESDYRIIFLLLLGIYH